MAFQIRPDRIRVLSVGRADGWRVNARREACRHEGRLRGLARARLPSPVAVERRRAAGSGRHRQRLVENGGGGDAAHTGGGRDD